MFGMESDLYCPNITNSSSYLNIGTQYDSGQTFKLWVSLCEDVTFLNGQSDCYDYDTSKEKLQYI